VAQEVLSDLEVRVEQTGARVEIGPLPTIEGDPTQLRQLFQNVIGNALKFHRPETPPRITVAASAPSVEKPPSGEGHPIEVVHIDISDNGIGFDEVYRDRIFQPFQRLHGRGEYDGTGIGLAICRRIVERHCGSIVASGTPNAGSRFRITLPVQQFNEGADECVTSTQESSSSSLTMTPMIAN
jgi:signal transduction histidine kinase